MTVLKYSLSLLLTVAFIQPFFAQEVTWAGKRLNTRSMFLDPNEIQMFGAFTAIEYDSKTEITEFGKHTKKIKEQTESILYIPFGFGGAQSIVSKLLIEEKKAKSWEIQGEFGISTQFEWRFLDSAGINRNLLNSDYRITFSYLRNFESSSYRIRFFHVSSHLGDDFIIRNGVSFYTPSNMNYEQLDFTYFKDFKQSNSWYIGAGSVVRPNSTRAAFSYMSGIQLNWEKQQDTWGWTAGANLKGHQETHFNPNIKLAAGPAYFTSNKDEPIRLVLEYYLGHLPYSQYESQKVSWFGAGLYFYL